MTPEEIEAFRGWCRTFEVPPHSLVMKALEHIDQQATSLAATEERVREHEAHEIQTHAVLGKILGTDDTLENVARRAVDRIAELEAQIIQQTGVSACRIEERERLQKRIALLQEIAIEKGASVLFNGPWDSGLPEGATYDEIMRAARQPPAASSPRSTQRPFAHPLRVIGE